MCGIAGFSGEFDHTALSSALSRIKHRGPDDSGLFIDKVSGVGLAHTRLSILDPSQLGHQPMVSDDGMVVVVFNGEIYNFKELRRRLLSEGFVFKSNSDTEVLLNLYLSRGRAMLSALNGIFAFAIWDKKTQSLFVARDALGVKPLYYGVNENGFAFSSEIKSLLALVPDLKKLDYVALHRYLSFLWCPGEGTPFQGIKKLEPGHAMIVKGGEIVENWQWYSLPYQRNDDNWTYYSELDAVTGSRELLRQAVHRQMVADVPLGAFLSGGLDSSAVVAFAREVNPDIQCFSIEVAGGQERGFSDDLPYAKRVANHLGVALHTVHVDSSSMAGDLPKMIRHLDEPLADPAALNVLYISKLAREFGMKVLLSGAGGDDLFTGYRRHRALLLGRQIKRLLPSLNFLQRISFLLDHRVASFRRLGKFIDSISFNGDEELVNYFVWAKESVLFNLYTKEFRAWLRPNSAAEPLFKFLQNIPLTRDALEKMLALEQRFFLADHNLIYTDKMSMAVGVEVRVPFLDLDLVEFSSHIPVPKKQRGSCGKWVLKKAMEGILPKDVIYRPKSGFGAPIRRWIVNELRPMVFDLLSERSLANRGFFDPSAVRKLIRNNERGSIDAAYTIFSLLCIELWCREYLDNG